MAGEEITGHDLSAQTAPSPPSNWSGMWLRGTIRRRVLLQERYVAVGGRVAREGGARPAVSLGTRIDKIDRQLSRSAQGKLFLERWLKADSERRAGEVADRIRTKFEFWLSRLIAESKGPGGSGNELHRKLREGFNDPDLYGQLTAINFLISLQTERIQDLCEDARIGIPHAKPRQASGNVFTRSSGGTEWHKPDVFISYSRRDRDRAMAIADALQRQRLDVWIDAQIVAGERFDTLIRTQTSFASAVLVCWSEDALDSPWVRSEAAVAVSRNCLVSCLVSGPPPSDFSAMHYEDLSGGALDESNPAWNKVVARIRGLMTRPWREEEKSPEEFFSELRAEKRKEREE